MLDEDPRNVPACLLLAELYREANLNARAKTLYRKVLDIQPGHAGASDALAALVPRKEKASAGVAGLFRRR